MTKIYGIDLNKKITPLMVRDAILECFFKAHCEDTGFGPEEKDVNKEYCKDIVKKAFDDAQADFNNPTKEDIIKVIAQLAEFAKNFRNPKIIQKHSKEIMTLVEKLD